MERKREILKSLSDTLLAHKDQIIIENAKDLERMDLADSKYDRLRLTDERIEDLASSMIDVSKLSDPTGQILSSKVLENGLKIEKKSVALGVVAVIYESRPNVTVDVAALCIQSGNVCLLRGGSDAWFTNSYLVALIRSVLERFVVDANVVQLLPTDRELVQELLTATGFVDIIIPRGSQSLIDFVRENAKVPVIETGAGVCHTYVDKTADLDKAAKIVANAKISRPSVCNALDTVLLDKEIASAFMDKVLPYFEEAEVEIFAAGPIFEKIKEASYPYLQEAQESDFGREFLDFKCSVKAVEGLDEALEHIAGHSSRHSECIVSSDPQNIETFMNAVDAAAVYANASTRFTDGGEFGLGAEIGISTQKLHARGPFALEKLVTEKWFVTGDGQVR
jgi:glutamate-5-semialdehyde dehydrogenase